MSMFVEFGGEFVGLSGSPSSCSLWGIWSLESLLYNSYLTANPSNTLLRCGLIPTPGTNKLKFCLRAPFMAHEECTVGPKVLTLQWLCGVVATHLLGGTVNNT